VVKAPHTVYMLPPSPSVVQYCVQRTQHLLRQRANSVDVMDNVITRHRDDLKKQQEAAWSSQSLSSSGNQRQQSEMEISLLSSDDDESIPPAPLPSKRGGR